MPRTDGTTLHFFLQASPIKWDERRGNNAKYSSLSSIYFIPSISKRKEGSFCWLVIEGPSIGGNHYVGEVRNLIEDEEPGPD